MNATRTAQLPVIATSPNFDTQVVADAVTAQFGLSGEFVQLVSERDQNFCLSVGNGTRYVVKVTCAVEDPSVSDFQIAALRHLENGGMQGVPRIVATTAAHDCGRITSDDGKIHCLRIVTYIDGALLADVDITPNLAAGFGRRIAQLDRSLLNFSHVGDSPVLLWDTQRAGGLLALTGHISNSSIRDLVEEVLRDFLERVMPGLDALGNQVIHNDANTENVLVDAAGEVSGIIDFGDMLRAPRIIEVATAASYLRADGNQLLRLIAPFVAGYHSENPLRDDELDVLFDLIRTRFSMTLTILSVRLAAGDKRDLYSEKAVGTERGAADFLRALSDLGKQEFLREILVEI